MITFCNRVSSPEPGPELKTLGKGRICGTFAGNAKLFNNIELLQFVTIQTYIRYPFWA